jgi:DNA-binding response OmpR family regulator
MTVQILIVEDAEEIRLLVGSFLEANGMSVRYAGDAKELDAQFAAFRPDVVLLDVNLPDADGIELAKRLRLGEGCGLIFVTSRDGEDDILQGLEAGADDYVTKPINLRTLLARIRSVLRRTQETLAVFDGWILDGVRRELFNPAGQLVELTTGEFNILAALVSRRFEPVSRDFLLDVISNRDPRDVDPQTVDNLVMRLRRKLQFQDAKAPIETVRGVGYILAGAKKP